MLWLFFFGIKTDENIIVVVKIFNKKIDTLLTEKKVLCHLPYIK